MNNYSGNDIKSLCGIIGILVLLVFQSFFRSFIEIKSENIHSILRIGATIFDLLVIIYLYYFVVICKHQKLSFISLVLISVVSLYHLFLYFYPVEFIDSSGTINEKSIHEIIFSGVPSIIGLICYTIISIQLIRNTSLILRKNLRIVGVALLISCFGPILIPIVLVFSTISSENKPDFLLSYRSLFFRLLSPISMIFLYVKEIIVMKKDKFMMSIVDDSSKK
jgi:hypothetical protein